METWSHGPGVVELPSGRRVRGRGLRRSPATRPTPGFGVYLLARPPLAIDWDHRWVRCRDFGSPADPGEAVDVLREALARSESERVEVGCGGGVGRTGIALSIMAILDGVDPDAAVGWVRSHYDRRAVETPWQRRWVSRIGREVHRSRGA